MVGASTGSLERMQKGSSRSGKSYVKLISMAKELVGKPVFVGYPVSYDFMFV
jgi:hypothetical protein